MKTSITLALAPLAPVGAWSQLSRSPIPDFTATALTGENVSAAQLIGRAKEKSRRATRTRPGS